MHKPFVFFGTPYIARDTLAYLVAAGYRPALVVTSPDAPRGRGHHMTPSETKSWALEHNIPVLTPERIDTETVAEIARYHGEYAVVVAYGKILPQALIDAFPLGILNIHYSLLPQYRGASPVEAALLHGDTTTGVTIQKMVYELDAGDIIARSETVIEPIETTRELRPRLITLGAELLVTTLPAFEDGTVVPEPQDHQAASITRKIPKAAGELSFSGNAQENWNKYRAYAESPGTFFFMEKDGTRIRVKIRAASFEHGIFTPTRVVPEGKSETDYSNLVSIGWRPVN